MSEKGNPYRYNGRFGSPEKYDKILYEPNKDKNIKEADEWRKNKNSEESTSSAFSTLKETDSETFSKAINKAKQSQADSVKWRVSAYGSEHYKDAKCFKTDDGSTVAVTDTGDIISVCASGSAIRGTGTKLMETAIKNGGTKLDSFSGNHGFYTKMGFEPISYTPFSEWALDDADRIIWKRAKGEPEDVIFYAYVGKENVKYSGREGLKKFLSEGKKFEGDDGYDKALEYRDKWLKQKGKKYEL